MGAALMTKLKETNAAIRKESQEVEVAEQDMKKHGRTVSAINAAKTRAINSKFAAIQERKDKAAERVRTKANKMIRIAKKRVDIATKALKAAEVKAGPFGRTKSGLNAQVEEAERKCKELKKNGEYVPERGDTSDWAFVAPTVPLPPGVLAAKMRHCSGSHGKEVTIVEQVREVGC